MLFPRYMLGGDKRDRTADLLNAIQALSQVIRLHTPQVISSKLYLQIAFGGCILLKPAF